MRLRKADEQVEEATSEEPAPVVKRPTHEAECFKPSAFASRSPQAERNRAEIQRVDLIPMGRTSHWMKDRKGKDVYRDAELFCERGKPMRRYVRLDGDSTFYPLFDDTRREPEPVPLGRFSRRTVLPGAFDRAEEEKTWPVYEPPQRPMGGP